MKRILLTLILINSTFFYAATQVITASPVMPTVEDAVLITFDATKASRTDLVGFTGEVYVHTGVKWEGSSDWEKVIGRWGYNNEQPKLTRTGTNTYTLSISPSIRQFYGIPTDKKVTQLCFVFRSENVLTDYKQTEDIFYTVYEQGLTVDITSPDQYKPIYELNSTIPIQVISNNSISLTLYIDGSQVSTTASTTISYSFTADQYGKHWIKAIASDGTIAKKDSVYIIVRPEVTIEDLPSGLTPGVNIVDNNTVTFVLFDPPALKQYCYLIGSFNDWLVDEQFYMKRTPDGKHYWLTHTGLNPDKEYLYQFLVDGELRLADPYCTKISDPWNDEYISNTNYPNLIEYPKGKTSGVASALMINKENYTWNTSQFTPPDKKDLVIYELHIRDFISGDYIKTVQDSLDYLQKLGVNAIELMPISEFEGNDSWGYNPSFYFAPDKAYGTPSDYKAFIDDCHSRGIAVIMDIVFNHSYGLSPLVQMYFDPEAGDYGQPTTDNPWYNETSPNSSYSWGFDFNHESEYTKQFVDSSLAYWLTEYKFDGFRFDFTKGFTNTPGDGSAYDASRIAILKHYADHIWSVNPNAYVILEHFCANSEEIELSNYGMLIWGNMNYSYCQASMGYLSSSDFSGISYKNRSWTVPNLVGYMESHDEERMMYRNLNWGVSDNTSYNIKDLNIGLDRSKMATLFFLTVPGPKMIWQFGELGYDYSIEYNGRVGRKPIMWDYYDDYNRRQLFNTYAQLIRLKKNYEVFGTDNYIISFSGSVKSLQLFSSDMDVVIAGNFNIQSETFSMNFPNIGRWYEYFTQDSVDLNSSSVNYTFNPGEYRMYTSKRIKSHDIFPEDINTENFGNNYRIDIWPNPNNGYFTISTDNPGTMNVEVSVYSLLGQKVYEKNFTESNSFEVNLNPSLPKGIYITSIKLNNYHFTKKIVLR